MSSLTSSTSATSATSPTSIVAPRRAFRLVCAPHETPLVEALLAEQGFVFDNEPFSSLCYRLVHEPFALGRSAAAFFGLIYIQDASSMLPPLALAPAPGEAVLDLCASPGSKSGFLAQLVGPHGLVLANEPDRPRLATLRQNLARINLWQCVTSNLPGEAFGSGQTETTHRWQAMLLDPPCSGWGTTDKHPGMRRQWQGERVKPLLTLQRALFDRAASLLAPGGRLVYSTCTTNPEENEAQVFRAVDELGLVLRPLTPLQGFGFAPAPAAYASRPGCEGLLRIDEATSAAQGFFVALLEKPGRPEVVAPPEACCSKDSSDSSGPFDPDLAARWNLDPAILPALVAGRLDTGGKEWRFIPQAATQRGLPCAPCPVQGLTLGANNPAAPSPRLRAVSREGALPVLDLERLADLQGLMQGASLSTGLLGQHAALFWCGLPLGRVRLKNGRAVWSEK